MDWKGQVAIVTGGSRGIGAATCRRLAARGAAVGINYVARSSPSRSAKRWGNRSSSKTSLWHPEIEKRRCEFDKPVLPNVAND